MFLFGLIRTKNYTNPGESTNITLIHLPFRLFTIPTQKYIKPKTSTPHSFSCDATAKHYCLCTCKAGQLRLPFTLSGGFSFPYVTPLIRIGLPETYISMEGLRNYLNDGEKFV